MKEKEFSFIITQKISRTMTKAKLSEKMYNFLNERTAVRGKFSW